MAGFVKLERLPPAYVPEECEVIELPMTAEDRQRVRRRVKARDGQELALALPTGATLRVGAVLYRSGTKSYVVTAAPEDVLVVRPRDVAEAARAGHLVGNMHRDVDLGENGELATLWDAPLEARLRKAGFEVTREMRPFGGRAPGEHAHSFEAALDLILPPRYQGRVAVSPIPMGSADLKYGEDGKVCWDEMWGNFCDLALAGGPTHRGKLLEAPTADEVASHRTTYEAVVAEIERGIGLVTGLKTLKSVSPGWVGVQCKDEAMAVWLLRAIIVENVMVRRQGDVLYLPAGPGYRLAKEVKNVITVIAKTHHYYTEHLNAQA